MPEGGEPFGTAGTRRGLSVCMLIGASGPSAGTQAARREERNQKMRVSLEDEARRICTACCMCMLHVHVHGMCMCTACASASASACVLHLHCVQTACAPYVHVHVHCILSSRMRRAVGAATAMPPPRFPTATTRLPTSTPPPPPSPTCASVKVEGYDASPACTGMDACAADSTTFEHGAAAALSVWHGRKNLANQLPLYAYAPDVNWQFALGERTCTCHAYTAHIPHT
eukprot:scaffold82994_cov64-Phaeocystis_antarctica.AAC.2